MVFHGPAFWTAEPGARDVAAVEVGADGRVTRLHARVPEEVPGGPRHVALPGALALPGLMDAHLHLSWVGRVPEWVDLRGAASPAEVRARVEEVAARHPELAVIAGAGWDQTRFPGGAWPTAADLGPGDRPVVLSRVDGHALWVNGAGLARAHAHLAEHGEVGGELHLRDAAGAPTGVIIEPSPGLRQALSEAPSDADRARWLVRGLAICADAGLVAVHDMATTVDELAALLAVAASAPSGRLPLRVHVWLEDAAASWAWLAASDRRPHPDVAVHGIKLFADGALGSRGAALADDYSDAPGQRGIAAPLAPLERSARRAAELGVQLAVHAIGDRGNAHALDLIAVALAHGPARAHRVEHAQVVAAADWDRFAALGAIASMQPSHATSDMRWAAARLGEERLRGAYAWRTALRRGVPLAFGSDAPVEGVAPALGLYAAVTRQDAAGEPPGGWRPEERLTLEEAVAGFTAGAAFAASEADTRGRLAVGRPLDLTVYDRDPRDAPARWLEARPTATVVDGRLRLVGP